MSKQFGLLLVPVLLCAVATALLPAADVLATPASAIPPAPTRGMSMVEVRAQFGAPERVMPPDPATAAGPLKPPIVRWVYGDFTVYFERNIVIHTVLTYPREAPPIATSSGG